MVDPPHRAQVASVVAATNFAVTAAGTQFKVWELGAQGQWACSVVGSLHGQPCTSLALSSDASMLAAAFGPELSLWLPTLGEHVCSLQHSDKVTSVSFVGPHSAHLVSTTADQLWVWDLVSLQGEICGMRGGLGSGLIFNVHPGRESNDI